MTKIQELVYTGARSEKEVRRHLKIFVQRELYRGQQGPQKTNRRFYPSKATIRSHIYKSVVKERFSKIDQEDLQEKVKLWQESSPEDKFAFHPYATYSEEEEKRHGDADDKSGSESEQDDEEMVKTSTKGLLFVHQTKDQRRLLERYGNEISMLDATYKTTKYSLPLFFVVVKTNVDYQIVGSFVVQSETSDAIYEALSIIKSWNPKWFPSYFMVDYSEEEMSAIAKLFPGNQTLPHSSIIFILGFVTYNRSTVFLAKICAYKDLQIPKNSPSSKIQLILNLRPVSATDTIRKSNLYDHLCKKM